MPNLARADDPTSERVLPGKPPSPAAAERPGAGRPVTSRAIARAAAATAWRCGPPLSRGQALAALALLDPQQHALGIDVADLERDHLGDAQSGAVCGGERRLVLRPRRRLEQQRDLLDAEHRRQPVRFAHDREPPGKVRPVERYGEEETQGRDRVWRSPGAVTPWERDPALPAGRDGQKIAAGGVAAEVEACRMVSEKIETGLALQALALTGVKGGTYRTLAAAI
jgi:hypothetical protein